MLFLTFFATPAVWWMALWLGLGLIGRSERSWMTFVIPLVFLALGHPNWVQWYIGVIWLCDFFDKPLFSSEDEGVGSVNAFFSKFTRSKKAGVVDSIELAPATTIDLRKGVSVKSIKERMKNLKAVD